MAKRIGRCKSCGALVEWAVTERGRPMPVDVDRRADGNIVLSHRGGVGSPAVAVYQSREDIAKLRRECAARGEELALFVSHFATCPNAGSHRRARAERAQGKPRGAGSSGAPEAGTSSSRGGPSPAQPAAFTQPPPAQGFFEQLGDQLVEAAADARDRLR